MKQYIDAHYFFQAAGDIVPLNAWVPEDIIDQIDTLNADPSKHFRWREDNKLADGSDDHYGPKGGVEYNHVPEGWGLPSHAGTIGSLLYNKGDYLYPHRDKFKHLDYNTGELSKPLGLRLITHINHNNTNEFTFIVGGKIVTLEPGRWYVVNTQLLHSGFSFVDGVYHLSADLQFDEENVGATTRFLMDNIEFTQPKDDRKGVDCGRN